MFRVVGRRFAVAHLAVACRISSVKRVKYFIDAREERQPKIEILAGIAMIEAGSSIGHLGPLSRLPPVKRSRNFIGSERLPQGIGLYFLPFESANRPPHAPVRRTLRRRASGFCLLLATRILSFGEDSKSEFTSTVTSAVYELNSRPIADAKWGIRS